MILRSSYVRAEARTLQAEARSLQTEALTLQTDLRLNPAEKIEAVESVETVFEDGAGYDVAKLAGPVRGLVGLHRAGRFYRRPRGVAIENSRRGNMTPGDIRAIPR
jgi:hypothetical protein